MYTLPLFTYTFIIIPTIKYVILSLSILYCTKYNDIMLRQLFKHTYLKVLSIFNYYLLIFYALIARL